MMSLQHLGGSDEAHRGEVCYSLTRIQEAFPTPRVAFRIRPTADGELVPPVGHGPPMPHRSQDHEQGTEGNGQPDPLGRCGGAQNPERAL